MKTSKIRVVIIDDHPLVREGIKKLLEFEEDIEVLDMAGDGQGAINIARKLVPDVILMDINMPGTNGIEATKVIKREFPQIGIVALTAHEEKDYVLDLVRAGVSGYVLKDICPEKLVETIREVAQGRSVIDPSITKLLFTEVNRMTKPQNREEGKAITSREMDILKLLARGLSNKEIASELSISEKTVKNHITSIFRKIKVEDRTQAVLYAVKHHLVEL
ncbi:MAG TPA: response regulator transcription factor [Peptococcaceae bacterium]|nr:response regulator transcription factor [Clostridia bacterium]HOB82093.1 response regulator transcription factor [Peptococcaceae bacterium]HPZ71641.1 response regulator transcription factor [Peptococcaceae bacterium]HQD54201.1 response regulator transcription factor [Peptococcaceae bacterium]